MSKCDLSVPESPISSRPPRPYHRDTPPVAGCPLLQSDQVGGDVGHVVCLVPLGREVGHDAGCLKLRRDAGDEVPVLPFGVAPERVLVVVGHWAAVTAERGSARRDAEREQTRTEQRLADLRTTHTEHITNLRTELEQSREATQTERSRADRAEACLDRSGPVESGSEAIQAGVAAKLSLWQTLNAHADTLGLGVDDLADLQDRARTQLLVLEQCHAGLAPGAFAD